MIESKKEEKGASVLETGRPAASFFYCSFFGTDAAALIWGCSAASFGVCLAMKWQIWWLHRCIRPRRLLTWKPQTFRAAILTYLDDVDYNIQRLIGWNMLTVLGAVSGEISSIWKPLIWVVRTPGMEDAPHPNSCSWG